MYQLRKFRDRTISDRTAVINLDPEKFRNLSIPYSGNSEEEFLNYINETDFWDIESELDAHTRKELDKFYDDADWEEFHDTSWDRENTWLESGKLTESGFEGDFITEK